MHVLQELLLTFAIADLGLLHPGLGVEEELKEKIQQLHVFKLRGFQVVVGRVRNVQDNWEKKTNNWGKLSNKNRRTKINVYSMFISSYSTFHFIPNFIDPDFILFIFPLAS